MSLAVPSHGRAVPAPDAGAGTADCLAEAYPPFSPEGNHVLDNRLSLSTVMRHGLRKP